MKKFPILFVSIFLYFHSSAQDIKIDIIEQTTNHKCSFCSQERNTTSLIARSNYDPAHERYYCGWKSLYPLKKVFKKDPSLNNEIQAVTDMLSHTLWTRESKCPSTSNRSEQHNLIKKITSENKIKTLYTTKSDIDSQILEFNNNCYALQKAQEELLRQKNADAEIKREFEKKNRIYIDSLYTLAKLLRDDALAHEKNNNPSGAIRAFKSLYNLVLNLKDLSGNDTLFFDIYNPGDQSNAYSDHNFYQFQIKIYDPYGARLSKHYNTRRELQSRFRRIPSSEFLLGILKNSIRLGDLDIVCLQKIDSTQTQIQHVIDSIESGEIMDPFGKEIGRLKSEMQVFNAYKNLYTAVYFTIKCNEISARKAYSSSFNSFESLSPSVFQFHVKEITSIVDEAILNANDKETKKCIKKTFRNSLIFN